VFHPPHGESSLQYAVSRVDSEEALEAFLQFQIDEKCVHMNFFGLIGAMETQNKFPS
jgi:hypothetical protein